MLTKEEILARNNVQITGSGDTTLMLAHGFGCDQNMWRYLVPGLIDHYKLILFDYVGSGQSQLSAFNETRYSTLEGYAQDISEICQALNLHDVHFVGHSVSCMIGLLAAIEHPQHFATQIMICPSPCFLNKPPDYQGGFDQADLEELIDLMDRNYMGWSSYLSSLVLGTTGSEMLLGELSDSFCSTDPVVAKTFAKTTFFSDYRHRLPQAKHPTLLLQSQVDALADENVGNYIHANMPGSTLRILPSEGHCIHMTHPELVGPEIRAWLDR